MNQIFQSLAIVLALSALTPVALAQENPSKEEKDNAWSLVLLMANSHIPAATEGGKVVTVIPTWGLDLDYRFSPHWSIALQTDVKIQSFEVSHNETVLERSFPFTVAIVPHYYLAKNWSFMAGPGYEIEKNKNIFLIKAGAEYGFELTERFEFGITAIYENRWEVYDGISFGASFIFALGPR
jgi:hypothetical protein